MTYKQAKNEPMQQRTRGSMTHPGWEIPLPFNNTETFFRQKRQISYEKDKSKLNSFHNLNS